jgi:hypothetical protein
MMPSPHLHLHFLFRAGRARAIAVSFLMMLIILVGEVRSDDKQPNDKTAKENPAAEIVPLEDCTHIHVYMHTAAWIIDFLPDGSGSIQYGSSFGDGGQFPAGTVDFKSLFNAAQKKLYVQDLLPEELKSDEARRNQLCGIVFEPTKNRRVMYSTNRKAIQEAFEKGFNATGNAKNRLDYLRLFLPPFAPSSTRFSLGIYGTEKPTIKGAKSIGMFTRMGWQLHFNSDGSGEMSFMNMDAMTAKFPPKSFKMKKVFERNFEEPKADQADRFPKQHVIFATKNRKSQYAGRAHVPNLHAANALFQEAWEKAEKPAGSLPGYPKHTLESVFEKVPAIRPVEKE